MDEKRKYKNGTTRAKISTVMNKGVNMNFKAVTTNFFTVDMFQDQVINVVTEPGTEFFRSTVKF